MLILHVLAIIVAAAAAAVRQMLVLQVLLAMSRHLIVKKFVTALPVKGRHRPHEVPVGHMGMLETYLLIP